MREKTIGNKKGAALLIAIVIMAVLMMLSLALLLVSFSLFATANRQQDLAQCKEITQTLSLELQEEIALPAYSSYEEEKEDAENKKNQLWFYLRKNIGQSSWPYFNADERGHTAGTRAYRSFELTETELSDTAAQALVDGVTVTMYWESEANATDLDATHLIVIVTCEKNKQKSTITTTYELSINNDFEDAGDTADIGINPEQPWSWAFNERG